MGQHIEVLMRKSESEGRLEIIFKPLTEEGTRMIPDMLNSFTQSLATQLASFFGLRGKIEDV